MPDDSGPSILARLGDIDIYLLDQLMKGRITPAMDILDAGCGGGRNLSFMLTHGYRIAAIDQSSESVDAVRERAATFPATCDPDRFRVGRLDDLPFADEDFDAVICNAVFHFAADEDEFRRMTSEVWRVLRPGGMFFARLASSIGLETVIEQIEGRRHLLPDGTERFLVDQALLLATTEGLGGELLEPIKTVNVQGLRCMTTWVVGKTKTSSRGI